MSDVITAHLTPEHIAAWLRRRLHLAREAAAQNPGSVRRLEAAYHLERALRHLDQWRRMPRGG